jgi:ATP synthase protein I
VNTPDPSQPQAQSAEEADQPDVSPTTDTMDEYYQLKRILLLGTLALTGVIFVSVLIAYSLNTALNYAIGATAGLVYLRMLAKEVERLGNAKASVSSSNRVALFIGLIVVATQLQQLEVLPIFLGFMTYKAAILIYAVQTALPSGSK